MTVENLEKFGCSHYKRNCMIKAPCCNKYFSCRFCHDENCDHEINRHEISHMKCLFCGKEQKPAHHCISCHKKMAHYFCKKCNFFDDNEEKDIFHCDDCGICRVGKKEDYFHCKKCNTCINAALKDSHKCVENTMKSNCPICMEYMFSSTDPVTFLNCGHSVHANCLKEYLKHNYKCPVCNKSAGDMGPYFKLIDEHMKTQKMPTEFEDTKANITCCDCEQKSTVNYHFQYHKCQHCKSYNTKIDDTYEDCPLDGLSSLFH